MCRIFFLIRKENEGSVRSRKFLIDLGKMGRKDVEDQNLRIEGEEDCKEDSKTVY